MIDPQLASFLQEGVFIDIATRTDHLEPKGARAVAAAVDADGAELIVFLPEVSARGVLPDLESNGQIAVGFARPPDERACQIKGTFAGTREATEQDRALVEAQRSRWLNRITTIGMEKAFFEHWPSWPCVAIRVRVEAIFNQTPGPGTGAPLR